MSIINKMEDSRKIEHNIRNKGREDNRIHRIHRNDNKAKIKEFIYNHIYKNFKSYIIVMMIFIIGIVLGVIFINKIEDQQLVEIKDYLNESIVSIKENYQIDSGALLQESLWEDFILTNLMWFIGSTVIGLPIVFAIVLYRGFCFGYTISAVIAIYGTQKGIIFSLVTMLLQNIIFIPALFILTVSGIRLYRSIMKDKRRENIKLEILRHTICSVVAFIMMILSSFIETYLSSNLFVMTINLWS